MQSNSGLSFHDIDNEQIICYSKQSGDRLNVIVVAVNLDPHHVQSGWLSMDLETLGFGGDASYQAHDLLTGARFLWQGTRNYIELDPRACPRIFFDCAGACEASTTSTILAEDHAPGKKHGHGRVGRIVPLVPGRVIYELHVRAFYDSNGDGIGDFQGLTQKLDYLQDLGVTAVWLFPFILHPSKTTGTTSRTTRMSIRPMELSRTLNIPSRRTAAAFVSSPSWFSITLPISTHGFSAPAGQTGKPERENSMSGTIARTNTGRTHYL